MTILHSISSDLTTTWISGISCTISRSCTVKISMLFCVIQGSGAWRSEALWVMSPSTKAQCADRNQAKAQLAHPARSTTVACGTSAALSFGSPVALPADVCPNLVDILGEGLTNTASERVWDDELGTNILDKLWTKRIAHGLFEFFVLRPDFAGNHLETIENHTKDVFELVMCSLSVLDEVSCMLPFKTPTRNSSVTDVSTIDLVSLKDGAMSPRDWRR